jgi:CCR4-NOT transcriptional regulation complex NOT5 subunit
MALGRHFRWALVPFLVARLGLADEVSISSILPISAHSCVEKCVYYSLLDDMGDALQCGTPYENECYCATETASASAANDWINNCASERCAAGDRTRDISTMRSVYGRYCMGAGFTQDQMTEWYTSEVETTATSDSDESTTVSEGDDEETTAAEPNSTDNSVPASTTTSVTLVTQTTDSEDAGTQSQSEWLLLWAMAVPVMVVQLL